MQHVWGRGGVHTGFWWGDLKERDHLEDLDIYGRIIIIIIIWVFKKRDAGMDWIDLVQDRDRWQALVNAVMNFRVP